MQSQRRERIRNADLKAAANKKCRFESRTAGDGTEAGMEKRD